MMGGAHQKTVSWFVLYVFFGLGRDPSASLKVEPLHLEFSSTVVFRAQVRVPCPMGAANELVPRDSPTLLTCTELVNGTNQNLRII